VLDQIRAVSGPHREALRGAQTLEASVELASRLDAVVDCWAPRGEAAIALGTRLLDGGLLLGAWSHPSSPGAPRRRTGGPVLRLPPGTAHLAVWAPSRDSWMPTPPNRVANRNARVFARALRGSTGGRELLLRDGGVVGCFGWAWGPARGLTLEAFVAGGAPLQLVEPASVGTSLAPDPRDLPLAAGLPMRALGDDPGVHEDLFARLVDLLAAKVGEVVPRSGASLEVDALRPVTALDPSFSDDPEDLGRASGTWTSAAPLRVAMGACVCQARCSPEGVEEVRIMGEIFRPDDLDARCSARLCGPGRVPWPSVEALADALAAVDAEAVVQPEGTPPRVTLAASLHEAIDLAREHAR